MNSSEIIRLNDSSIDGVYCSFDCQANTSIDSNMTLVNHSINVSYNVVDYLEAYDDICNHRVNNGQLNSAYMVPLLRITLNVDRLGLMANLPEISVQADKFPGGADLEISVGRVLQDKYTNKIYTYAGSPIDQLLILADAAIVKYMLHDRRLDRVIEVLRSYSMSRVTFVRFDNGDIYNCLYLHGGILLSELNMTYTMLRISKSLDMFHVVGYSRDNSFNVVNALHMQYGESLFIPHGLTECKTATYRNGPVS